MTDTRRRNNNWCVTDALDSDRVGTWAQVQVALLMDIRDELQRLNGLLQCHNFREMPIVQRSILRALTVRPKITKKQAARVLARVRNRRKK